MFSHGFLIKNFQTDLKFGFLRNPELKRRKQFHSKKVWLGLRLGGTYFASLNSTLASSSESRLKKLVSRVSEELPFVSEYQWRHDHHSKRRSHKSSSDRKTHRSRSRRFLPSVACKRTKKTVVMNSFIDWLINKHPVSFTTRHMCIWMAFRPDLRDISKFLPTPVLPASKRTQRKQFWSYALGHQYWCWWCLMILVWWLSSILMLMIVTCLSHRHLQGAPGSLRCSNSPNRAL